MKDYGYVLKELPPEAWRPACERYGWTVYDNYPAINFDSQKDFQQRLHLDWPDYASDCCLLIGLPMTIGDKCTPSEYGDAVVYDDYRLIDGLDRPQIDGKVKYYRFIFIPEKVYLAMQELEDAGAWKDNDVLEYDFYPGWGEPVKLYRAIWRFVQERIKNNQGRQ